MNAESIKQGIPDWMAHWTDRGPDPDYNDIDLRDLISRAVREGARAGVEVKNYREGGGGGESWQKWILGILGSLAVAAILGGIAMYGQLSALTQKVDSLQGQVDRVEKIVEPRYRSP